MQSQTIFALALATLALVASPALCAEPPAAKVDSKVEAVTYLNIAAPTLGGKQVWADELLFHQWRIQRCVVTGHYRLLDENNIRHAWGTFAGCRQALEQIKQRDKLPAMRGKVTIVLHGLGRSRGSMGAMAEHLEKNTDHTVLTLGYPSAMGEVEQHAVGLARVIANLDGVDQINLVGHSLGNIVIRRYLFGKLNELPDAKPDQRIRRIVMIGAPNNGAQFARTLTSNAVAKKLMIDVGMQLGAGWEQLEEKLAIPKVEFGIIAGGKADDSGFNPLLEGDDDFVVTVEETRLPGARDFFLTPVLHSFLMDSEPVQQATRRFIEHGYFVSEAERQPIEKVDTPK